jgi:lysophospholipase L1-like esterase
VCSVSTADVPTGSYLVDTQPTDVNLRGCTAANRNWSSSGSFAFSYGDPHVPGSQQTDMDVHQLGAGLGGHIYFTHTDEPADSQGTSYWGVTGTWSPTLPKGRYQVKVFVPDIGATATEADYTISNGLGYKRNVTINQNASNGWVTLATTWLGPGASVSLTNLHVPSTGDLAFSGMAFAPVGAGQYAMIGDSYSSGEGTGNHTYDDDTDNYQPSSGCPSSNIYCVNNGHRSQYSYNRVFAAGTKTFAPRSSWVDVACSGALIGDFTANNPTGQCPNEPAQQNALGSSTSLVTVTFGGNDLNFQPIMEGCAKAGITNILTGSLNTCQSEYGSQLSNDIAGLTNAQGTGKLDELYQQIRAKAPNADVTVLGYPHLFVGTVFNSTGRCMADAWITNSDQDWLNTEADAIDQAISTAAARAGFDYLSTSALFSGHELCTSSSYLTGILDPTTNDNAVGVEKYLSLTSSTVKQQFFHPNIAGYQNEATLLAAGLQVP